MGNRIAGGSAGSVTSTGWTNRMSNDGASVVMQMFNEIHSVQTDDGKLKIYHRAYSADQWIAADADDLVEVQQ